MTVSAVHQPRRALIAAGSWAVAHAGNLGFVAPAPTERLKIVGDSPPLALTNF
jgi:hypothetical protein